MGVKDVRLGGREIYIYTRWTGGSRELVADREEGGSALIWVDDKYVWQAK